MALRDVKRRKVKSVSESHLSENTGIMEYGYLLSISRTIKTIFYSLQAPRARKQAHSLEHLHTPRDGLTDRDILQGELGLTDRDIVPGIHRHADYCVHLDADEPVKTSGLDRQSKRLRERMSKGMGRAPQDIRPRQAE